MTNQTNTLLPMITNKIAQTAYMAESDIPPEAVGLGEVDGAVPPSLARKA